MPGLLTWYESDETYFEIIKTHNFLSRCGDRNDMRVSPKRLFAALSNSLSLQPRLSVQPKALVRQSVGGHGQNLSQTLTTLSTFFRDFTPIPDVYLGLFDQADRNFLFACEKAILLFQNRQVGLARLRTSSFRETPDYWVNPPKPNDWAKEVWRQRLHAVVRKKLDREARNSSTLVEIYQGILSDQQGFVADFEGMFERIRTQNPGWWDVQPGESAALGLIQDLWEINDQLERVLGTKDARYMGQVNFEKKRVVAALDRYQGIGVEIERVTGFRPVLPTMEQMGDCEAASDFIIHVHDFFHFQTYIREVISRTPKGFLPGDFAAWVVPGVSESRADGYRPEGSFSRAEEVMAFRQIIFNHLSRVRGDKEKSAKVKEHLLTWAEGLEQNFFEKNRLALRHLRSQTDLKVEPINPKEIEALTDRNRYFLGEDLCAFPIEKKFLFFTLRRLVSQLPHAVREVIGATDFHDFPTHHLTAVEKRFFITAVRAISLFAEIRTFTQKVDRNLTFGELEKVLNLLVPAETTKRISGPPPMMGPPMKPPPTGTLFERLLEENTRLEDLLKVAGKTFSTLVRQFDTGEVSTIGILGPVTEALRIFNERVQGAQPRNYGG